MKPRAPLRPTLRDFSRSLETAVVSAPRVDTSQGTSPNQPTKAEFDNGWRECKVGVIASMLPGSLKKGEYRSPSTLVQSHVATMGNI